MKKAENFDEIFAQRGEQVQPENMVKGDTYLTVQKEAVWLSRFIKMDGKRKRTYRASENLSLSGFYLQGEEYETMGDEALFFKATPDQVELLNSYRI